MLVKNISHDGLIITEYNGKRFIFKRNVPVEIDSDMYQSILLSGHISASQVVPVEPVKEVKQETIIEKVEKVIKHRGKRKNNAD